MVALGAGLAYMNISLVLSRGLGCCCPKNEIKIAAPVQCGDLRVGGGKGRHQAAAGSGAVSAP